MREKLNAILEKHKDVFPVPVIAIANDLGIDVYETREFAEDQSGCLKKIDGAFEIHVNARHPSTRKRFTIAHEIGHFVLDQDYFNGRKELVDDLRLNRVEGETDEDMLRRDAAANDFAAELLMPKEKFLEITGKFSNVDDIAEFFHVSTGAVSVRANKLLNIVFS